MKYGVSMTMINKRTVDGSSEWVWKINVSWSTLLITSYPCIKAGDEEAWAANTDNQY